MKQRAWRWVCVLVGSLQGLAAGQDVGRTGGGAPKPVRRFFDRPIDLWRTGLEFRSGSEKAREDGKAAPPPGGEDWGQIVRLPDGQMAYRELPKPLVRLLEDPSTEHVRAYFDWRLERARKILRAAERVKEYRESQALGNYGPVARSGTDARVPERSIKTEGQDVAPMAQSPPTVLYFHQAGCLHCDRQDRVLKTWLTDGALVKLEVVEGGTRPELWQKYRIRGTPSLAFLPPDGGAHVLVEGFADRDRLDGALQACRSSRPTTGRGEQP